MPRVTVAIPTHNRADLVVEALDSVLAQEYADREVVVVDNGSTDETEQRLTPYLDRIHYVRQENRGRAGSRNRALAEASGEFVAFLDSDDLWLPGKLERQVAALDAMPDVGLVHGHVEVIDESGRPLPSLTAAHRSIFATVHRDEASYAQYALTCMCLTSTIMVRRTLLERLGGYDTSLELEDLDLYLRIAAISRIHFLDGLPLARYRSHDNQTGNESLTRGQIAVCNKHLSLLEASGRPDARRVRRNLAITLARSYHLLADAPRVRQWTINAVRIDPSALFERGVMRRYLLSFVPRPALLELRRMRASRRVLRARGLPWKP